MNQFCDRAIAFYEGLEIHAQLPEGIDVLNPYRDAEVQSIVRRFYRKHYQGGGERLMILGINPGRFGAGITGITFTDPIRLEQVCGIPNDFKRRSELSSRFVYQVVGEFGGAEKFFSRFFLSAVSPLGFTRSGRNLNYYDDRQLETSLKDFIAGTLKQQCEFGILREKAVCLGEGKNYRYLEGINRELRLFGEIIPLPHPRWVMQYRFRQKEGFVRTYLEVLNAL